VTDAGVAHLGRLKGLRRLKLANARLTDAGLAPLRELPDLEDLDLKDTQVTDRGVATLTAARPKLKVAR
jgi:hypothetical protein